MYLGRVSRTVPRAGRIKNMGWVCREMMDQEGPMVLGEGGCVSKAKC